MIGETVKAFVALKEGCGTIEPAEIIAFCRLHMAGYKVPREISFHDVFPRDAAGKLLKRQLREPYWAGRAARV